MAGFNDYLDGKEEQVNLLYENGKILGEDRDHLYRDIEQMRQRESFKGRSFLETCIRFSETRMKIRAMSAKCNQLRASLDKEMAEAVG